MTNILFNMVSPTYNKLLETLRAVAESMCTLTSSLRISESISHSRLLGCATALPSINRTEDTLLSRGSRNLPLSKVSSIYLKSWNLEPGVTSYLSEQCCAAVLSSKVGVVEVPPAFSAEFLTSGDVFVNIVGHGL